MRPVSVQLKSSQVATRKGLSANDLSVSGHSGQSFFLNFYAIETH